MKTNSDRQSLLTQRQFQVAAEAGAFKKVVVEATWTRFSIFGEMQSGGRGSMVSSRKRLRQFMNPAAALALLRRVGVTTVEVRLAEWDVEMSALSMRLRPDVTARKLRAKRIAEAAYYPSRPPEPEQATREDQLGKLVEEKLRRSALQAELMYGKK